ncbi:hypothetical protein GCM10009037_21370 [Halarchaeum grantii]|uniref:Archaeal Type IV pilin N-terminal domain-containing protein n=1 Tax=Halarchaeum grantii TaxID=1193105 RepID=A0A830F459_9EURY|nr:hypothetical protein [Halarchaeum grantii]GGL37531.1 hypothetical protein GCM10009037_21370 [Halarchaeum grantii]
MSSVLATLLLTGIVAITVTASGAAYIDHSLDGSAAGHTVGQVDVSANDTTVDVVHLGGDSFDPDTLEAVLKSETDSVRVPFTDGTIDGGGDFDPASTWHYDYSDTLDGHLTKVYVVYTPKNDVLDVERFTNTTTPVTNDDSDVESGTSVCPVDWSGIGTDEAFLDTNGNGAYDAGEPTPDLGTGLDTEVPLIVPESVTIHPDKGAVIRADEIYFAGTLVNANKGPKAGISLVARGCLRLDGAEVGNDRDLTEATFSGANVELTNSTVRSKGRLDISAADTVSISNSTVTETKDAKKSVLSITGTSVEVRDNSEIISDSLLKLTATGGELSVKDSRIHSEKSLNNPTLTLTGNTMTAVDSSLTSSGPADIEATSGTLDLRNVTVHSEKSMNSATITMTGESVVAPAVDVSTRGSIEVKATAGDVNLSASDVEIDKRGQRSLSITAHTGDIDLSDARFMTGGGPNNVIVATVDNTTYTVVVTGATFEDDDKLDVEPDGASTDTAKTT